MLLANCKEVRVCELVLYVTNQLLLIFYFFWWALKINQITPLAQGGAESSVRRLLTKHPTHSCQVRGLSVYIQKDLL